MFSDIKRNSNNTKVKHFSPRLTNNFDKYCIIAQVYTFFPQSLLATIQYDFQKKKKKKKKKKMSLATHYNYEFVVSKLATFQGIP